MSKFKIGDRVRRTKPRDASFGGSDEFTVCAATACGSIVEEKEDGAYYHIADSLELVAPATNCPIRTVTRREIVPGRYGGVVVERNTITDNPAPFVRFYAQANANELREAAHIFNQIAEVLEEQMEGA